MTKFKGNKKYVLRNGRYHLRKRPLCAKRTKDVCAKSKLCKYAVGPKRQFCRMKRNYGYRARPLIAMLKTRRGVAIPKRLATPKRLPKLGSESRPYPSAAAAKRAGYKQGDMVHHKGKHGRVRKILRS